MNKKKDLWAENKGKMAADDEDDEDEVEEEAVRIAREQEAAKTDTVFGLKWQAVVAADVMVFLSICFAMALMGAGPAAEYWALQGYGLLPAFQFRLLSGMSFNRWKQLKKFFCVYVPTPDDIHQSGPNKGKYKDKACKVRPLVNILGVTFLAFFV